MKTQTSHQLVCRQCRFFQPEGRYHGSCTRMNVMVVGNWQACPLVIAAFDSRSETLRERLDEREPFPQPALSAIAA